MADALSQLSRHLASTVEAASRTVVAVHGRGRLASSGIIWEPGLVVTAEETVERDTDLVVTLPDGRRVEATLAGRDPSTDIAVLRFGGEAPAIAATVASDMRKMAWPPVAHGIVPTAAGSMPSCVSISASQ